MRIIKKLFLILYTLFLAFVVFFNTANIRADSIEQETSVYQYSNGIDDYFLNCQELFDYQLINYRNKNGFNQFYNYFYGNNKLTNWNYFVIPAQKVLGHENDSISYARGWVIYEYAIGNNNTALIPSSGFSYMDLENFHYPIEGVNDRSLIYQAKNLTAWNVFVIYNDSNNLQEYSHATDYVVGCPLSCLYYSHSIVMNNISNTSGSSQVTTAIQQQTNTIKEESQKQHNAIATATQTQTNELLDTNNTGNETMSVNDTTTDTSADLSGLYNSINSAFTDNSVQTFKEFTFTLPNGDNHTVQLLASTLLTFLNSYPVLKAFYQSIFWVIFGGYVIFDFKKIINKMKEGNIDNVVGTSSPVDSVVNMSLK